ncbi:XRE family transcriptional regulator [Clostridium sp. CF012]|uniref:XRE family transcriptional regulator n=1 Tax=Clostridium sp. CF012 TaxID=2843319 RepID=UPI001C0E102F|nr:XRE family transcriptional regulator [Clostridium sp. CF012]MBU3146602.1 XRE family transcriptional regulator [Clostridium sp. CF012]
MFRNLLAEMSRQRITRQDIASCLGVSEKTARNYINGATKISWCDTLKIRNTFFTKLDIEYLFQTNETKRLN